LKNFENIEDLFKDNLSGFEADPGVGVWESISQNLASQQAAAGSTAAGTGAASKAVLVKWIAGVAIVSSGIGITAGYFYSENRHEAENKAEVKESNEVTVQPEEKSPVEDKVITENTTEIHTPQTEELHSDKVVIKDEKKQKTIIVSVKEKSDYIINKSVSDKWITKNNVFAYPSNSNNANASNNTENNSVTETVSQIKEEHIDKPVAVIMRSMDGGPAPLTVTFSSKEKAEEYEWIFGDEDIVATSQTVSHTFEAEGEHSVILIVKDKKGNIAKEEIKISVSGQVKDNKPESKLITHNVNIITPNNDGANDYLSFECANLETFVLKVIDRHTGKIYFETTDPDFKWNGTLSNGDLMEDGIYIYYYKATGKDGIEYKDNSTITIKR